MKPGRPEILSKPPRQPIARGNVVSKCLPRTGSNLEAQIWFVVPRVPPSVNHYVKHTRTGRHYVTEAAKTFMDEIYVCSARRQVRAKAYELEVTVYLGKGGKGDGDNFWKVIADGLVKAGTIHSDAAVTDWIMHKRRDANDPRTEIWVRRAILHGGTQCRNYVVNAL